MATTLTTLRNYDIFRAAMIGAPLEAYRPKPTDQDRDLDGLAALIERAAAETIRPGRGIRVQRDQDAHVRTIRRLRALLTTLRTDPAADFFRLALTASSLNNCCTCWMWRTPETSIAISRMVHALYARIVVEG